MTRASKEDMFVIRMGINTLLECVRQMEEWWKASGDTGTLRSTQRLGNVIAGIRQKFLPDGNDSDVQVGQALVIAEGLRDAAGQCTHSQAALQARLMGAAEAIERLCRSREVRL